MQLPSRLANYRVAPPVQNQTPTWFHRFIRIARICQHAKPLRGVDTRFLQLVFSCEQLAGVGNLTHIGIDRFGWIRFLRFFGVLLYRNINWRSLSCIFIRIEQSFYESA